KLCSRYSFTIYVLHHMAHLWPMWIYGYATGHETTYYWGKAMSLSWSVPLAILFLATCCFVLRLIGPDGCVTSQPSVFLAGFLGNYCG
ncbi:MAG: hypothetical protein ACOVNQ_17925, partial [Pirellula sp.]